MIISNATTEKTYKADVKFNENHTFLTDPKADAKFKETFADSLKVARTHDGHWEYVKNIMKPYIENTLFRALPDVGYWSKDFKLEFKSVLQAVEINANNA